MLNKLFGYRWSMYVVRHGNELVYAMHENSAICMVGYVMGFFEGGATPAPPWSLHLNFNKKHRSFELRPEHFTSDGEDVTTALANEIAAIDPGWKVKAGEPVFMEVATKKKLPISRAPVSLNSADIMRNLEARLNAPKEVTFFSIMREVFGQSDV